MLNAVNTIRTIELPSAKVKENKSEEELVETKSKHWSKEMHCLEKVQDIIVGQYSEWTRLIA